MTGVRRPKGNRPGKPKISNRSAMAKEPMVAKAPAQFFFWRYNHPLRSHIWTSSLCSSKVLDWGITLSAKMGQLFVNKRRTIAIDLGNSWNPTAPRPKNADTQAYESPTRELVNGCHCRTLITTRGAILSRGISYSTRWLHALYVPVQDSKDWWLNWVCIWHDFSSNLYMETITGCCQTHLDHY